MVMMDAISRFVPGVVGDYRSVQEDSITMGLLDYPHYTRPREYRGMKVPEVLLNGDHGKVELFRLKESIKSTVLQRPDLFLKKDFTMNEKRAILELIRELLKDAE
jgi:tRNA (guanine37-N1)-methyltransferase